MKNFSKLSRFPLGTIKAEGFLKEQLLRGKDGMAGHLPELEPDIILNPYLNKQEVSSWTKEEQCGWGAEISGNYWTGYIQHAFTLDDSEMIETATNWVNEMMKKQKDDGYLGTFYEDDADIYDDFNAWGTATVMRGLLAFYEATKREDVFEAVYRCMKWFTVKWAGDNKTSYAGALIIEPMVYCYLKTGDEELLKFSEDYAEYLCEHDIFRTSYKAYLEGEYHYNANHTVAVGVNLRLPALLYSVTGKEKYLKATKNIIKLVREKSTQLSGGPVSNSEYLGPVSATAETEYCCFAIFNASYSHMSYITGQSIYGDYMEEMFYNGAQGARKKDERAIAYMSAPNQIYATNESSSFMGDMQVYAPCYPTACCPVNSVVVVPEFIKGMLLHDEKDNIYCTVYGPCSLCYKNIKIKENTLYPFRNDVSFEIKTEKAFSLYLKVPVWAKAFTISVNGNEISCERNENGYTAVEITESCKVDIKFKAEVEVLRVDDSDASKKYPLAIKYGALLFSYHIPERWTAYPGTPHTPMPEGWSWYKVTPVWTEADIAEIHERTGMRRYMISWNVAMDEKLSADDIEIELCTPEGYAWSNPYIKLHTHCYKAPYLCSPYPPRTFEPYQDKQFVTDRLDITLVPYGCTNLRITYFPIADLKKDI